MAEGKPIQPKTISGLISIFSFVLSLPILASVVWLWYMKDYDCENLLRLPRLQVGICIGMIALFVISNVAVFLRSRVPIVGFLLVLVPLIVMLTMGLALVGAYNMESRKIFASPRWFKSKVHDDRNWQNIKSCIYDSNVCNDLVSRSLTLKSYDFSTKKLSSLESGCCRPPVLCAMEYVNATYWRKQDQDSSNKTYTLFNGDCDSWENDSNLLCYDCQSCRNGFLRTMESKWWKLGVFLIVMSILLTASHLLLFLAAMWERIQQ
ncbi:tetraspanin-15-like [Tripterygium wilfordii]|nr:tetraspanin-15-like [Tripterygium wilfordii]